MTRRQPSAFAQRMAMAKCAAPAASWPEHWPLTRHPMCNRPVGHEGDHMEIRRRDFAVLARWPRGPHGE